MILKRNQVLPYRLKRDLVKFLDIYDPYPQARTARVNLDNNNQLGRVEMVNPLPSNEEIVDYCGRLANGEKLGHGSGCGSNYVSESGTEIVEIGDGSKDHRKLNPVDKDNHFIEKRGCFRQNEETRCVVFLGVFVHNGFYKHDDKCPRIGYVKGKWDGKEEHDFIWSRIVAE